MITYICDNCGNEVKPRTEGAGSLAFIVRKDVFNPLSLIPKDQGGAGPMTHKHTETVEWDLCEPCMTTARDALTLKK